MQLDHADIQGNVLRAYGRFSFPFARYFFLHVETAAAGRALLAHLRPRVTTGADWAVVGRPAVTLNLALTCAGLARIGLPDRVLAQLAPAFREGMRARASVLGDRPLRAAEADAPGWDRHWDRVWRGHSESGPETVHLWVSMNAPVAAAGTDRAAPELDAQTRWLRAICREELGGRVRLLAGHGGDPALDYQPANAVFTEIDGARWPTPREHFGLTDGVGDPVFAGQSAELSRLAERVRGRGKWMAKATGASLGREASWWHSEAGGWSPLQPGEFLLGLPDEAQELPPTARPPEFVRNSTYMVYRKLHENVGSWHAMLDAEAPRFARARALSVPAARETLIAKIVGRWSDGIPLAAAPTHAQWVAARTELGFDLADPLAVLSHQRRYLKSPAASQFLYADDPHGARTPRGAHLRRVNPRDSLDPLLELGARGTVATTRINNRRRILRRGLPYGPGDWAAKTDRSEQGVTMMVLGADPFRQFEFVQSQWIATGLDFNEGNNTCPLTGAHDVHRRLTIPGDLGSGDPPYVLDGLRTFVETRGGEYFFVPSLRAIEMLAHGTVDPT